MGIRYTLELSEEQSEIIKIALEEYFRLRMNQTWDFADRDEFKRSHVGFGHHSLQQCKQFIEENKTPDLRNVILVHLSKDTDEENIRSQVQSVAGKLVKVDVAKVGITVELSKYPW